MAQQLKNQPAMQEAQETQVQSLGGEDPLEEENGNLLQYSCLKNSMGRRPLWATAHGVTKSPTTRLSNRAHTHTIHSTANIH